MTVAEAVLRSALERRETRGAHVRDDYPAADDVLAMSNVVVRGVPGALRATHEPRAKEPENLRELTLQAAQA